MRIMLFAVVAMLVTVPASAQKSIKSLALPPAPGPTIDMVAYRMLTVTYPAVSGGKMTLTTPAGRLVCTPPGAFQPGLPVVTCSLKVRRLPLALEAAWLVQDGPLAQTGNGASITGAQWQGDCTGTAGTTCILDMSADRTVSINPFAKASGQ